MTPDRTYWRACDDKRLIEEARDSGHELCIAVGERLATQGAYAALDLQASLDDAEAENQSLKDALRERTLELDAADDLITDLQGQLDALRIAMQEREHRLD